MLLLAEVTSQRAGRLERPESSPLWLKAAETMRRLAAAHKDLSPGERLVLSSALYNEACVRAVDGQAQKALGALAEAIDAGFDLVELLETDPDLDSLRALPRFRELKTKAEHKARIRARERARRSLAVSRPYRFDFELPDLGGKTVSRSDFEGKVAIVNVWGTWCPPCRRLVPRLVRLLEREGKRGLAVVGINYERVPAPEVNATVKAFVSKNKVPYPCLLGDDETRERIPRFAGFPTTLFLDRAGMVRLTVHRRTATAGAGGDHDLAAGRRRVAGGHASRSPGRTSRRCEGRRAKAQIGLMPGPGPSSSRIRRREGEQGGSLRGSTSSWTSHRRPWPPGVGEALRDRLTKSN